MHESNVRLQYALAMAHAHTSVCCQTLWLPSTRHVPRIDIHGAPARHSQLLPSSVYLSESLAIAYFIIFIFMMFLPSCSEHVENRVTISAHRH
jgi:hypothetical protein